MKYIAAYTLLVLGGKATPSAEDVKGVVEAVGAEVDMEAIEKMVAEVSSKGALGDVIANGKDKIYVCSGGGGGSAPAAGGAAEAEKVEEKEEEEEEEIDMGGGMDMFGGEEGGGDDY